MRQKYRNMMMGLEGQIRFMHSECDCVKNEFKKLLARIEQLECGKHNYVFARTVCEIDGLEWYRKAVQQQQQQRAAQQSGNYGFGLGSICVQTSVQFPPYCPPSKRATEIVFRCSKCGKEITKTASLLDKQELAALKTLGVIRQEEK
jgi:hypothetical protein